MIPDNELRPFLKWWMQQEFRNTYPTSIMGACEAAFNAGRAEIADLKLQLAERDGIIDIIIREIEQDAPEELANDYGGLGWENKPQVIRARAALQIINKRMLDGDGNFIVGQVVGDRESLAANRDKVNSKDKEK